MARICILKKKLPFSSHNSPQNIKYGQIEQGLYVYRFLLLLHKEVYHTISLLKQHTLQGLLPESKILQRLERKSSMRFPGVAIVKKQTYNNSTDRFAVENIFFVLCKQNFLICRTPWSCGIMHLYNPGRSRVQISPLPGPINSLQRYGKQRKE